MGSGDEIYGMAVGVVDYSSGEIGWRGRLLPRLVECSRATSGLRGNSERPL